MEKRGKRALCGGLAVCLLVCLLLGFCQAEEMNFDFRMPGPIRWKGRERKQIIASGSLQRTPFLEPALCLLEEGNPFAERYQLLTCAEIDQPLPFGVPYLWGGRAASHVFAKAPDYVVQMGWIDSPIWYRKELSYLYGFDCVGLVRYAWEQAGREEWPGMDGLLMDWDHHVYDHHTGQPDWEELAATLQLGDIVIRRSPNNHTGLFAGTLRQYGYTEKQVPELAEYLDYPLILHTSNNASIAARFQWLLENGLPKYHAATVTDGGVMVSVLGVSPEQAPGHVLAQKQDTWYFTLPDGTWLTVFPWENVSQFCWYRYDLSPAGEQEEATEDLQSARERTEAP